MTTISHSRPPRYHHFVLLLWEERSADGSHAAWRLSLRDSKKESRIGFKNVQELTVFLEKWMKDSSESNDQLPKESE